MCTGGALKSVLGVPWEPWGLYCKHWEAWAQYWECTGAALGASRPILGDLEPVLGQLAALGATLGVHWSCTQGPYWEP